MRLAATGTALRRVNFPRGAVQTSLQTPPLPAAILVRCESADTTTEKAVPRRSAIWTAKQPLFHPNAGGSPI